VSKGLSEVGDEKLCGKYLKARKLAREMEEKAKKTAQLKEEAKKKKEKVEELLKASMQIDIEVDVEIDEYEMEEKIDEAKKEIDGKNFEEAEKKFNEVIDQLQECNFAKFEKIIEPVENYIEFAEKDSKSEELEGKIERAKELIEKGEIEEGFEIAEETSQEVEETIEERIGEELEEIQSLTRTIDRSGVPIEEIEKIISKADYAYDASEYERAMSLVEEAKESLDEELSDDLEDMLNSFEKRIEKFEKKGMNVSEVQEDLEEAKKREDEDEYRIALKYIQSGNEKLDEFFIDILDQSIEELKDEIDEAKDIGASTEEVEKKLEEIKELREDQRFQKMSGLLDEAFEEISETKFNMVLNTIADSRDYFIKAKNIGADIKEPMELLSKARNSLNERNYKKALDWAEKGRERVEGLVKKFEDCQDEIEDKKTKMDELKNILDIDLSEERDTIAKAESKLMGEKYEEAKSILEEFEEVFDKKIYDEIMEHIDELDKLIMTGSEIDVKTEDTSHEFNQAVESSKSSNFIEAAQTIRKTKNKMVERIEDELGSMIQDIRKSLNMIEDIEENQRGDIQDLLGKADNKLSSGRYDEAVRLAKEAEEQLDLAQIGSAEKHVQKTIDLVERLEKIDIEDEELDLSSYRERIDGAKQKLEDKEHVRAVDDVDQMREELNEELEDKVEQLFEGAKKETVVAKKIGVDIEDFRMNLIECKKKIKQNNHLEAAQIAFDVKEGAKELHKKRKEAYDMISETTSKLKSMKEEGKIDDISELKDSLKTAKEDFENKDYSSAKERIEEIDLKISSMRKMDIFGKKKNEIFNRMREFESHKFGIESFDDIRQEIEEIESDAKAEEAYSKALMKLEDFGKKIDEKVKEIIEDRLDDIRNTIKSAEKLAMDTQEVWEHVKEIKKSVEEEDYKEGLKILEKCYKKLEKLKSKYEKAQDFIEKTEDELQEAENIEADVEEGKEALEKAKAAFKGHRCEEALQRAKEAENSLRKAQKEKVDNIIKRFKEKVSSLRRDQDTALANNLLNKAQKAKEKGSYKEAIKYSMQSEGELEKMELQQSVSKRSISKAEEKIKEAREKGLLINDPKRAFQEAKNSYQSGFYVKAFEKALEASQELSHSIKDFEYTKRFLENIETAISGLEEEGREITELEDIKDEVEQEYNKGDYEAAKSKVKEAEYVFQQEKEALVNFISEAEEKIDEYGANDESDQKIDRAWTLVDLDQPLEVICLINKAKQVSGLQMLEGYENTIEKVQGLVEKARKFGASVEVVDKEIKEAKRMEENENFEDALEKAKDALESVEKALEPYSPKIDVEVSEALDLYRWNSTKVKLENTGNGFANDIGLDMKGGEIEGFDVKDKMRAGEVIEITGMIKPINENAKVIGKAHRVFDQKELIDKTDIKIKGEETEEEKTICEACENEIKGSDKLKSCKDCGTPFHKKCLEGKEICPICGEGLKTEEKKKKRRLDMGLG